MLALFSCVDEVALRSCRIVLRSLDQLTPLVAVTICLSAASLVPLLTDFAERSRIQFNISLYTRSLSAAQINPSRLGISSPEGGPGRARSS